jgi:hypothetical protein
MSRLGVHLAQTVKLYRCSSCLGVLAHHDAVAEARRHFHPSHPVMAIRPSAHRCRDCHAGAKVGAARCERCGASLVLGCPLCARQMQVLAVADVVVDVCRPCELAFMDRGEFATVCNDPSALTRALRSGTLAAVAGQATETAVFAPIETVEVIAYAVQGADAAGSAALHVAGHGARLLSETDVTAAAAAAGSASLNAAQAATEGAGSVAEAVLELLSGIFDV